MKDSISRDLVKYLESNTLKYSEIQDFVYNMGKKTRGEKAPRGYWTCNIGKMIRVNSIIKYKKLGYFSIPGTSNNKFIYDYEKYNKPINKASFFLHPVIKKDIIENGLEHEYIW